MSRLDPAWIHKKEQAYWLDKEGRLQMSKCLYKQKYKVYLHTYLPTNKKLKQIIKLNSKRLSANGSL